MVAPAAAAAGVAGAKYAKDNPDQAKAGALILLVGGLILFNKISGTLDKFNDAGDAIIRGGEKTGDAVGNFFEGMFTGAETDYKIDPTITQPLGGVSGDYLTEYEGMEYEDFLIAKADNPSYVSGRFQTEEDDNVQIYFNYSTPKAIITTADKPGGGEASGGFIYDQATGIYNEPILDIGDRTLIPSIQNMGGAIRGLFR
jgi:hypothetical protein